MGNLKSDIEDVQDLVIELITKKVKKEVVPLCEAHSRKKKAAMMFICYDLRKKFKSLKESVERTAQTPINGIEVSATIPATSLWTGLTGNSTAACSAGTFLIHYFITTK